jgi:aspartyl-tRNA synthetase
MEKRSCLIGDAKTRLEQKVILQGWLDTKRNLKGIIFLLLRDYSGIIQVVISEQSHIELLEPVRVESVLQIKGTIKKRAAENIETNLESGDIEIIPDEIKILNPATELDFRVSSKTDLSKVSEELLFRHRSMSLRHPDVQKVLRLRHKMAKAARTYMDKQGFIEVETPILAKSTPEGARDFLVPSRRQTGSFFALPQSPQLFKQMSIMGGIDRYFQVARCFRDEDTRKDRLLEFTQLDIEMGFIDMEQIIETVEGLFSSLLEAAGIEVKLPLPRLSYKDVIGKYKSDKPDLRNKDGFGDQAAFWVVDFPLFEWKKEEERYASMHHPFTAPINEDIPALFEKNVNYEKITSKAYDLVWNGVEIGGGSIRIHDPKLQKQMFRILGLSDEEIDNKFGFLLRCLSSGAPPHGGLAIGFDRLVQILSGQKSLRHCVAFPMNQNGVSPLLESPSHVSQKQLSELGISVIPPKKIPTPKRKGIYVLDDLVGKKICETFENQGLSLGKNIDISSYSWNHSLSITENIEAAKAEFYQIKEKIGLVILDYFFAKDGLQYNAVDLGLPEWFKENGRLITGNQKGRPVTDDVVVIGLSSATNPNVFSGFGRHGIDFTVQKTSGENAAVKTISDGDLKEVFELIKL